MCVRWGIKGLYCYQSGHIHSHVVGHPTCYSNELSRVLLLISGDWLTDCRAELKQWWSVYSVNRAGQATAPESRGSCLGSVTAWPLTALTRSPISTSWSGLYRRRRRSSASFRRQESLRHLNSLEFGGVNTIVAITFLCFLLFLNVFCLFLNIYHCS